MKSDSAPEASGFLPLAPADLHLLMVLAEGPQYGYAIMKAIERSSGGLLRLEIGSLYRRIARLVSHGLVQAADTRARPIETPGPGRPRRYYGITSLGRAVFEAEVERLQGLLGLVASRHLAPGSAGR